MLRALRFIFIAAVSVLALGVGYIGITHPDSPLPRQYNPTKRLYVGDPLSFMSGWKLDAAKFWQRHSRGSPPSPTGSIAHLAIFEAGWSCGLWAICASHQFRPAALSRLGWPCGNVTAYSLLRARRLGWRSQGSNISLAIVAARCAPDAVRVGG